MIHWPKGGDGAAEPRRVQDCISAHSRHEFILALRNRATALVDAWIKCRAVMEINGELKETHELRPQVAAGLSLLAGIECTVWHPRFTTYPMSGLYETAAEIEKHERQIAEVEKRLGVEGQ